LYQNSGSFPHYLHGSADKFRPYMYFFITPLELQSKWHNKVSCIVMSSLVNIYTIELGTSFYNLLVLSSKSYKNIHILPIHGKNLKIFAVPTIGQNKNVHAK
jgi:hypothetical protein